MLALELAIGEMILSKDRQTFTQRIEVNYAQLSANSRKIADHLLHNSVDILLHTVAEIADITHTSKATVSRFFRQLGYASHADVRQELSQLRNTGYPIKVADDIKHSFHSDLSRIQQTFAHIDQAQLDGLISAIVNAKRISIIGFRNSYPVAMHFRQQLQQIHSQTRLLPLPGQSLSEELEDIGEDELVIIIGFRRRPAMFAQLLRHLPKGQLVLLADPSGQIYKDHVQFLFICQLGQEQALDSYAAPMSLISVICNQVSDQLGRRAQQRVQRISSRFNALNEIE